MTGKLARLMRSTFRDFSITLNYNLLMIVKFLKSFLPSFVKQRARNFITFLHIVSLKSFIPGLRSYSRRDHFLNFFATIMPFETDIKLIRLGGKGDGSYVIPNDLEGLSGLVSPGVGGTIDFDVAITQGKLLGILIDPTVDMPSNLPKNLVFLPKWLGVTPSTSNELVCTLEEIVSKYFPCKTELVLSMDIEGSEWDVIQSTKLETLNAFRIITLEIHDLNLARNPFNLENRMRPVFSKLLQNFVVVHLHPNNAGGYFYFRGAKYPNVIELSLIRKDRINEIFGRTKIPKYFDIANRNDLSEIIMPKVVYKELRRIEISDTQN